LAKIKNYGIYPTSGIKARHFKVFEALMTKLASFSHCANVEFIKNAKGYLVNFSDDPLDTLLKKKSLSILSDIANALPLYEKYNQLVNCYELLTKDLLRINFSASDLGLDESGLWVAPIDEVSLLSFKNVAILGLENANYPKKKRLDPIFKVEERTEINKSAGINMGLQKVDRFEMLVENFCQNIKGALYLGYQSHDLTSGKLVVPSSFYNRLLEFMGLDIKIENVYKICHIKESFLEDVPKDNSLYQLDHQSGLAHKLEDHRKLVYSSAVNELDYANSDVTVNTLSASSLESFFDCPFRFYLRYHEKMYPPDLEGKDLSAWLTSAEKGSLIHEVFENLLKPFLGSTDYGKYLKTLTDKKVEEIYYATINSEDYQKINRKVPAHIKEAEIRDYLDHVKTFVSQEMNYANGSYYPVLLEEPFEVAVIVSNQEIAFKGKIDRVDTDGLGNYKVLDYKTGKNYFKASQANLFSAKYYKTFKKYFQHGIYSIAVKDIFEKKSMPVKNITAGYYFSSDTGNWATFIHTDTIAETELLKFLEAYVQEANTKQYFKNPNSCQYCDYKNYCKAEQAERIKFVESIPQITRIESFFKNAPEEE
jgi:RecB family exonuclease